MKVRYRKMLNLFFLVTNNDRGLGVYFNKSLRVINNFPVDGNYSPDFTLNEFIRTVAGLRGTKAMCHEGGCGACVVAVQAPTQPNNELKIFSVNSVSKF